MTLSDGSVLPLRPNGETTRVLPQERLEYAQLALKARLNESELQIQVFITFLF